MSSMNVINSPQGCGRFTIRRSSRTRNLLLNCLRIRFGKQMEDRTAEVVCVTVGITQLIGNRIEEQIATLGVQINGQILEDVHVSAVRNVRCVRHEVLVPVEQRKVKLIWCK